jgi:hypothetical protein
MSSSRRRILAVPAALCLALSAAPGAAGAPPLGTPADRAGSVPAPKVGDTPEDFAQPVAPAPKAGDTPVDHPGASRAPAYDAPTTIVVSRPERTVVRDVDELLPVLLSTGALVLALAGMGIVLVHTRMIPRFSRSH